MTAMLNCALLLAKLETVHHGGKGRRKAWSVRPAEVAALAEISHQFGAVLIEDGVEHLLCRFPTADQALLAAIRLTEVLQADSLVGHTELRMRMGTLYGPCLDGREQIDPASLALLSQLAETAEPGEVLTTEATLAELSPGFQTQVRELEAPTQIAELGAQRLAALAPGEVIEARLQTEAEAGRGESPRLRLSLGDTRLAVTADHPAITIGRSIEADFPVPRKTVSRIHARIEHRLGRFLLIDESTNGTFVRLLDGKEVYLKHQELPLWGQGVLSLGEPFSVESPALIEFSVETAWS